MKKIALILCLFMLIPAFCLSAVADTQVEYSFGINAINQTIAEGQSVILTPAFSDTIDKHGNHEWCRIAIFDWSPKDDAYVLISSDTQVGIGLKKSASIPPHGFALIVNLGNDYPSLGMPGYNYVNKVATNVFNSIVNIPIGTKVYLTGIDLKNATFEYSGSISQYFSDDESVFKTNAFIHVTDIKPENAYKPDSSDMLNVPEFLDATGKYTAGDVTLKWAPVEDATEYRISISESITNDNGVNILTETTDKTEVTVTADKLTVGARYYASVYATNGEKSSPMGNYRFLMISERSLQGMFDGKTVVALGDSLTAWRGWVAMLEGELGVPVINAGVGGDTTFNVLDRIDKDVIEKQPELTIINIGMNDQPLFTLTGKNNTPIEQYEANYRQIIEKVLATGSEIVIAMPHDVCSEKYTQAEPSYNQKDAEGVTYVDRYNAVAKKLAEEYKLGLLDINTKAQDMHCEISLDGLHLNEYGQIQYAKWISDYLYEYVGTLEDWADASEAPSEEGGLKGWQIAIIAVGVLAVAGLAAAIVIKPKKKEDK